MEIGFRGVFVMIKRLFLASIFFPFIAFAADSDTEVIGAIVSADIERREIKEADLDSEDFEVGVFFGIMNIEDFGSDTLTGVSVAYHISEDFFMEATYGITTLGETSFERLSGSAPILTDEQRDLSYYDLSIAYNLFPGEVFISDSYAFNSNFYILAGAGNTDFADESHFTYSFGAGYRLIAQDWLALKIDVRDHIFEHSLLGETISTNNLSMQIGATVFF